MPAIAAVRAADRAVRSAISDLLREEVRLLRSSEPRRYRFEFAEADVDPARLGPLVLTDDTELFELLHHAHRARMPDRELRLELRGRRIVGLDDELRGLVAEWIDISAAIVFLDRVDLDVEQILRT